MRVHPQADYSRPGWLRHEAYCLGMITGWGSHHYDTMHWALQYELTGPSHVEGKGDFPDPERIWNVHGSYDVTLAYPNNVTVNVSDKHTRLKLSATRLDLGDAPRGTGTTSSDPQAKGATCRRSTPAIQKILDPTGLCIRCRQQVASQELARVRAVAQAAARARAYRPSQHARLHRELDCDETRAPARVGSEDRALQE